MSNLSQIFGAGLDVSTIEPQGDFDVLPPGKYSIMVDKAEVKQTKKGDGHYLELTMSILDGPAKNRKLWDRLNIQNPSQQCVDIGLRQLSALGRACGVTVVSSEDQFLGKVCVAHVKVKDEQNEIRTYSSLASEPRIPSLIPPPPVQGWVQQPAQLPTPQVTAPRYAPAAEGQGKPPWAR